MQTINRRRGHDRRQRDMGPPRDCPDRRRRAERRLPQVNEVDISEKEWKALFGDGTSQ